MSAKGRKQKDTGAAAEKPPSEFYPTPAWCTQRLLQHVELRGGWWLEPSAGDGAIIRAVNSVHNWATWTAIELRAEAMPELRSAVRGQGRAVRDDFLKMRDIFPGYDVCIGNPPFSLAAQFVDRALEISDVVVMLLRLNFLGSSDNRRSLFERRGMPDVYVLPNRPSFTGEGTDATEYGWFLWRRDKSQEGRVSILWDKSQGSLFGATP